MTKADKEYTKRKLILWYENAGNEEIGEALKQLDLRKREIIEYRYRDGMCWDYIPEKVGLSRAQCFRVHDRALERIHEFLKIKKEIEEV